MPDPEVSNNDPPSGPDPAGADDPFAVGDLFAADTPVDPATAGAAPWTGDDLVGNLFAPESTAAAEAAAAPAAADPSSLPALDPNPIGSSTDSPFAPPGTPINDPVSDYVADQTAGAPDGETKAGWASPARLGIVAVVLLALVIGAFVVTRTGDESPSATDVGSVQAAGGSTSSRAPGSTIIYTTAGTIDPATAGTAVPGTAVATSVAPASVVATPAPNQNPANPGNSQPESTTTTTGPCLPDLAATTVDLVNQPYLGFTVIVENLSDCPADNAIVTLDLHLRSQQFGTPSKGEWHHTDPELIVGTWTIGSIAPHTTEHMTFGEGPASDTSTRTGQVFVEAMGQTDIDGSNNHAPVDCPGTMSIAVAPKGPVAPNGTLLLDVTVQRQGPCTQPILIHAAGQLANSDQVSASTTVDIPGDGQPHVTTLSISLAGAGADENVALTVSAQNTPPLISWLYVITHLNVTAP